MEHKDVKNKIITISGEPVAGKGTVVARMVKKLKEAGYDEDKIHVITTGHEFRRYFNLLGDLIRAGKNPEEFVEKSKNIEELKPIFTDSKLNMQFKEAIQKLDKSNPIYNKNFTIEQANNDPKLEDIRKIVDKLIDSGTFRMGKKINETEKNDEIWIIDSRVAFHFIPDSFAVRLTCLPNVAGERLYNDSTRGSEDQYESVEEAVKQRNLRRDGEIKRYKARYNIDLSNEKNYNMIIDTSYADIDEIADTILTGLDRYQNGQFVCRDWTNPRMFIPTQGVIQTWKPTIPGKQSMMDIAEEIKNHGYNQDYSIDSVECDGVKYIYDGHHRNFAAACAKKTLVPYECIAKDDESVNETSNKAKEYAYIVLKEQDVLEYSYMIDDAYEIYKQTGESFSYDKLYPGKIRRPYER